VGHPPIMTNPGPEREHPTYFATLSI